MRVLPSSRAHGRRRWSRTVRTRGPAPGEVLVRVASVGVCGSDTHYYDHGRIGRFVVESPLVLGHEAAGEVTEVGPGGDPAGGSGSGCPSSPGCRTSPARSAWPAATTCARTCGSSRRPPIDGAFAEYVVVHEAVRPPRARQHERRRGRAARAAVGRACGRAGRRGSTAGSRVLVTGAGPIGLVSVQTALAFGATEVVVSDVNPARLALARELGATEAVDARERGVTDLAAAAEVLLECSGIPPAIGDGDPRAGPRRPRRPRRHGRRRDAAAAVGRCRSASSTLTGTFRYANTWPTAIALVASGTGRARPAGHRHATASTRSRTP